MEVLLSVSSSSLKFAVRASWDTQQRLPYNPNAPRKLKKNIVPTSTSPITQRRDQHISDLLKRATPLPTIGHVEEEQDETYLGYEKWLPTPPKVVKPRSVFNAATLAYIGDCIYELYARRHFLFPPLSIEEYNDRVMAVVRCEAQDALLQKLLDSNFLSDQERDVLRWGKNIVSNKTKTKKRAGAAVYSRASSLETLVGYLYLTNVNRLEKLMLELGFSVDSSVPLNVDEIIAGELNNG
ncbi:Mini-ribonuclease 3 [Spatholobus suberectus]|nr:Mini-ribonuclease 3 [Spatholobus suberectus]